jgi:hypothetical protein
MEQNHNVFKKFFTFDEIRILVTVLNVNHVHALINNLYNKTNKCTDVTHNSSELPTCFDLS